MNTAKLRLFAVLAAVAAFLIGASVFTVAETEKAILLQLGKIVDADFQPGLHFKKPFINEVRKFDARIRMLDSDPEPFLTSEKKNVNVDFYVNWRIADLSTYYTATSGGDENAARMRLNEIIKDGLKAEFSQRTIKEVVSGERGEVMDILARTSSQRAVQFGIEIVDVRVKRIDLPLRVSDSVYQRMRAERNRVAKDFRARGAEAKERIQADADRQSTVLLAEAERDAEILRGEGDAKAAEIYAEAFGKDPEFFAFHRSLQAYRNSMTNNNDMLVITPDSEFFRYLKQPNGK